MFRLLPGIFDIVPLQGIGGKSARQVLRIRVPTCLCREKGKKRREIPHIRRPTLSQERKRKKKSACSVRNDGWRRGTQPDGSGLGWFLCRGFGRG
jgi:hypothetical protein